MNAPFEKISPKYGICIHIITSQMGKNLKEFAFLSCLQGGMKPLQLLNSHESEFHLRKATNIKIHRFDFGAMCYRFHEKKKQDQIYFNSLWLNHYLKEKYFYMVGFCLLKAM